MNRNSICPSFLLPQMVLSSLNHTVCLTSVLPLRIAVLFINVADNMRNLIKYQNKVEINGRKQIPGKG